MNVYVKVIESNSFTAAAEVLHIVRCTSEAVVEMLRAQRPAMARLPPFVIRQRSFVGQYAPYDRPSKQTSERRLRAA